MWDHHTPLTIIAYHSGVPGNPLQAPDYSIPCKMSDVTIEIRKNGPYRIYGDVSLVDHEGNPVPVPDNRRKVSPEGKTWISLCRCGGSVVKPFCDGTHSRIGFIGAEEAVQQTEATPPLP